MIIETADAALTWTERLVKGINFLLKFAGYELVKIKRSAYGICPSCGFPSLRKVLEKKSMRAGALVRPVEKLFEVEQCETPGCSRHTSPIIREIKVN